MLILEIAVTDAGRIVDGFVRGSLRSGQRDYGRWLSGYLSEQPSHQAQRVLRAPLLYGVSVDRKAPCGGTLKGEALNV